MKINPIIPICYPRFKGSYEPIFTRKDDYKAAYPSTAYSVGRYRLTKHLNILT